MNHAIIVYVLVQGHKLGIYSNSSELKAKENLFMQDYKFLNHEFQNPIREKSNFQICKNRLL